MAESNADKHVLAKQKIRVWCKQTDVNDLDWASASDPTQRYNCFGFAVGVLRWWQCPRDDDGNVINDAWHWPGLPDNHDVNTYVAAAAVQGFQISKDAAWEEGFETIMLYYHEPSREFTHAARLKSPGVWESKLGSASDFEHAFDGIDSDKLFGRGRIYMKRPRPYVSPLGGRLSPGA